MAEQSNWLRELKVGVVGLGYVGLPLAVAFGKVRPTVGFDVDKRRVDQLLSGLDETGQISDSDLACIEKLSLTSNPEELDSSNCYIVTVPTPIDEFNLPDLTYLHAASQIVGRYLKDGDIVIYESTVYPGCTEEDCVPVLEEASGLCYAKNAGNASVQGVFHVGYSPERINPGDKSRKLHQIVKITSGSSPEVAKVVDDLYCEIISAGTYPAESIMVAEAAKVIENTQRDLNIALINEVAVICNKLSIDTEAVLKAAETKWNFQTFRPGLVGGHCIGVDPYYLTYKAQQVGYEPEVMLAGRKTNDTMGHYVANCLIERMQREKIKIEKSKILILGVTFKENCNDCRNSKVFDVIDSLLKRGCLIDICDPWVSDGAISLGGEAYQIEDPHVGEYDAIVLAVSHQEFQEWGAEKIRSFGRRKSVIYDLKYLLRPAESSMRL